jgi:rhodanese-related sulfurtransferase
MLSQGNIIAIVVTSLGVATFFAFQHGIVRLHRAREWLRDGAILVDVDRSKEFGDGHPHPAINVPLEDLARRAHEIGGLRQPIVVFSHRWLRGARAVYELRGIGYHALLNAAGSRVKEELSDQALRSRIAHDKDDDDEGFDLEAPSTPGPGESRLTPAR